MGPVRRRPSGDAGRGRHPVLQSPSGGTYTPGLFPPGKSRVATSNRRPGQAINGSRQPLPLGRGLGVGLGATTFDIHPNDHAYWRNVPAAVWHYKLGGYQVLKKWLSYRERPVLGRPLLPAEVQHFAETARRIAAILLLVTGK